MGQRGFIRARVPVRREAPAEHGLGESAEVRHARLVFRGVQAFPQPLLTLPVPTIQDNACLHQGRGRDDEARGADEADPLQVGGDVGVGPGHPQFVSGHR